VGFCAQRLGKGGIDGPISLTRVVDHL